MSQLLLDFPPPPDQDDAWEVTLAIPDRECDRLGRPPEPEAEFWTVDIYKARSLSSAILLAQRAHPESRVMGSRNLGRYELLFRQTQRRTKAS